MWLHLLNCAFLWFVESRRCEGDFSIEVWDEFFQVGNHAKETLFFFLVLFWHFLLCGSSIRNSVPLECLDWFSFNLYFLIAWRILLDLLWSILGVFDPFMVILWVLEPLGVFYEGCNSSTTHFTGRVCAIWNT